MSAYDANDYDEACSTRRDENGTEIFRTEPHRFLHLIRSNSYFRTNSNSIRNLEHQIRNRNENGLDIFFRPFSTFLLLIRNIPNSKFGLNQNWPTRSPTLEKLYLFHTISDEDDFYMKIVALDEIYNFLVFSFFI
jgi:hypothetical protein